MRVCFLTLEWSGLERFVRREVEFPEGMPSVYLPWLRYKERGYHVDVFMVGDFKKKDILDFAGCNVHLIPRPRLLQGKRWAFPLNQLRLLADSLIVYLTVVSVARKQKPPDIVYAYRVDFTFVGWALAKRYRALFVKRFFGTWAYAYWTGGATLRYKINMVFDFLRWIWPSDMLIVTHDGTEGDKIAKLLRIPESKFRMWLNGVKKRRLPSRGKSLALRAQLGLSDDDFVLMCLSRLTGWKRQDRIIRSMPLILKEVPDARLVVVGNGPKRKELEQMVRELDLQAYTQFLGAVEHSKVPDVLAVADVFLQTNDLSCLGSSLLEAIACGRVVVTWDVGTTQDVIKNDENGCLMPDAEPETIAQTVIALAKDPNRRKRLAQGAERFAQEHLQSWDERLNTEVDLIERIWAQRQLATHASQKQDARQRSV
jgi:glycosyltransferase involved in cell wall biosynthesis